MKFWQIKCTLLSILMLPYALTHAQTQVGSDIDGGYSFDRSGTAISMPDAKTLAVGEPFFGGSSSGRVRVYTWDGSNWTPKGNSMYGEAADDRSGSAVSMGDSNTVAIGAYLNDGNGSYAGHVRVYAWTGSTWAKKGLDIDGEQAYDRSGHSVSMPDANTVAIGAIWNDFGGSKAGHVRIFKWSGTSWVQKGTDIDGEQAYDLSGYSVSMPDSNTLAIGATDNDGNGTESGHVRIYIWNGSSWIQKGSDIDGEASDDRSGSSVMMPDSNTVAIGAAENDGNGADAGHVRIYTWSGSAWVQKGIDLDGDSINDRLGFSVSMPTPNILAVGAPNNDVSATDAGHVRLYEWSGTAWVQLGTDIAGDTAYDYSGRAVSMPDENIVAIGAPYNDGGASDAGQVRVFTMCTPTTANDSITACNSYIWMDGNTYTSSNNTATHTVPNSEGCDSIISLQLTINYSSAATDTVHSCGPYTWRDGNTYTSSNNTVKDTILNAKGCDSIISLDLTINFQSYATDSITACGSYTWIDGNTYTSSNNTARDTIKNANGCDSIISLELSVNHTSTATDSISACDTYMWIDGKTYTSSNNTATDTILNAKGCDSIITLDLSISYSSSYTDVHSNCDSYTWIDGKTYTSSNNSATHTITNNEGCDSVITLDLNIKQSSASTDVIEACDSFLWIDGKTYSESNNTATHQLVNAASCDSIITLDLTITTIDTQVTSPSDTVLSANQAGAAYQWLDCDSNNSPVPSETGQTFTSRFKGNYSVEISKDGCVDTSACHAITPIGIVESTFETELRIYPNPTDGRFALDLGAVFEETVISITDMNGRLIRTLSFEQKQLLELSINEASGAYLISVKAGDKMAVIRLIKH